MFSFSTVVVKSYSQLFNSKGGLQSRVNLRSSLQTTSCHIHQKKLQRRYAVFQGASGSSTACVTAYPGQQIYRGPNQIFSCFSRSKILSLHHPRYCCGSFCCSRGRRYILLCPLEVKLKIFVIDFIRELQNMIHL